MTKMNDRISPYALAYGVLIWFEATLMIRLFFHYILVPHDPLMVAALFAATPALVLGVGWSFFAWFKTPPLERAMAAILICAPGLVADMVVFSQPQFFFPGMSGEQETLFIVWLAWAYGTGLISGVWPRRLWFVPSA